jgi:molybdopterin converting factor small subunit
MVLVYGQGVVNAEEISHVDDVQVESDDQVAQIAVPVMMILAELADVIADVVETAKAATQIEGEIKGNEKPRLKKDAVRKDFTEVSNGVRKEIRRLEVLKEVVVKKLIEKELQEKHDDYDKAVIERLKELRQQIEEQREKLYKELTDIVVQENVIIELLQEAEVERVVSSIQDVVGKLQEVRKVLKKWTQKAQTQINEASE